jgi:tRNA threonylcarbamoyladenosine biosynthesis protein TsaB
VTSDGDRLLALDTATTRAVVALGRPDGSSVAETTWIAGYRHGETLLPAVERLLDEHGVARTALVGIIVGTGPGAFTGLRVGLATAKGLAHGLGRPITGVSTAEALLAAAAAAEPEAADRLVLLLPAGPSDRVVVERAVPPRLVAGGTDPGLTPDRVLVALDLDGRAPDDALVRGATARDALGTQLLRLGAARLFAGGDDLTTLVPEYVTLPRGTRTAAGEVSWSRDPR